MGEVSVVDVKPQLVLGIRRYGKHEEIATMIAEICQAAVQMKVQIQGAPIYVCHEMSAEEAMAANREGNVDIELAMPVSGKVADSGEVKCYELPGGKMAKITYQGPYHDCGQAYYNLFAWIEGNAKKVVGPTREVYLNDPGMVSPGEILTEIYAPIE